MFVILKVRATKSISSSSAEYTWKSSDLYLIKARVDFSLEVRLVRLMKTVHLEEMTEHCTEQMAANFSALAARWQDQDKKRRLL